MLLANEYQLESRVSAASSLNRVLKDDAALVIADLVRLTYD